MTAGSGSTRGWILEVVDDFGNSTVWDDGFDTDAAALDEGRELVLKLSVTPMKAASTHRSLSDLVNDAVRHALAEDQEDLSAFEERGAEQTATYEELLNDLKVHGKI